MLHLRLLPEFAKSVIQQAPEIRLHVRQPITGPSHIAFEEQNIDLAIGFNAILRRHATPSLGEVDGREHCMPDEAMQCPKSRAMKSPWSCSWNASMFS